LFSPIQESKNDYAPHIKRRMPGGEHPQTPKENEGIEAIHSATALFANKHSVARFNTFVISSDSYQSPEMLSC